MKEKMIKSTGGAGTIKATYQKDGMGKANRNPLTGKDLRQLPTGGVHATKNRK
jgi:hypothetical protein